jgi:predicted MFS family arabinose efflux permease
VPETRDEHVTGGLDLTGGAALAVGLTGVVYALIEGPATGWPPATIAAAGLGVALLVAFAVVEHRTAHPMVPLSLFGDRQFSGANLCTLFVYAAIGVVFFLTAVHLQTDLGYSPIGAGAAFLPVTGLMLVFSARAGRVAQRTGPKLPMTAGPLLVAAAVALLARVEPGTTYVGAVLPAALVLGAGLVVTVAPLTAAVLAAVPDDHAGIGSAVNNAVARLGGLLSVAVLPAAAGLTDAGGGLRLGDGFARAMLLTAALPVLGGLAAALTVHRVAPVAETRQAPVGHGCLPPCVAEAEASVA